MTGSAEVRRFAIGVILAAADGRAEDMHLMLADADRDTLAVAVGGVAIALEHVLEELPAPRRAQLREQFGAWALEAATRTGPD